MDLRGNNFDYKVFKHIFFPWCNSPQ